MGIKLQEAVARRTECAAEELIVAARRVQSGKIEWHPLGDSRTVLEIIQECGRVNDRWAQMLESGKWITWSSEQIEALVAKTPDLESAISYLEDSTARYVKAVREMPGSRLDQQFESPWRSATIAEWLMHALWHMSYH